MGIRHPYTKAPTIFNLSKFDFQPPIIHFLLKTTTSHEGSLQTSSLSITITLSSSLIHSLHMATCLPFRSIPFKPNTSSSSSSSRPAKITCSSVTAQSRLAKQDLLALIADQDRGLKTQTDPTKRASIIKAIDALADLGNGTVTTGSDLSATWRLLWTTEKEQLFIIQNASVFGTRAGDVLQVIDVDRKVLNNVITFPPDGVFFVRSTIEVASPQRVNFRFTSAVLRGKSWEFPLPPFGQGWFETVYLDDEIRVVKDIREDYLVVDRAPYAWTE